MEDIYFSQGNNYNRNNPVPQSQNIEPPQKKKKKKHKFLRFIVTVVLVFFVINFLFGLIITASGYKKSDNIRNPYISSANLHSNALVTNILLIGTDDDNGGSARSDSMILVSVDYVHQKIKLTSFLRDCWVEIPSTGKSSKINSAFAKGGAPLLCNTIEYNFLININHYVKVDFDMFREIIDELGGVEVEVTQKEADFINRTTRQTVSSGFVTLNGDEALVYARIRKLDSDYKRTERQRKIISSLINKAKHKDVGELLEMVKKVVPLVESDMSAPAVSRLMFKCIIPVLSFEIEQMQLPDDTMMTTGYVGDQWAEIPNLDLCRENIYDFIYR